MKLILIPKNKEEIKLTDHLVDGFILGIDGLSTNLPTYFSLEDVKEILKLTDKEIFISLNKNMHSKDLNLLKTTLLELEKINIKGILYYDVSLVNLKQELNLKKDLVWNGEHLVTNSESINFWKDEGVNNAYLSNDITKEEVIKIKEEVNIDLMMDVFGYVPIFTSYRHLVKNYLKTFSLKDDSKINYIEKEGKIYPIVDYINTTVYSNNILSLALEYLELSDISYGVINSFNIDTDLIVKVIEIFKNINKENVDEYKLELSKYFDNIDNGFLDKETIYKVVK